MLRLTINNLLKLLCVIFAVFSFTESEAQQIFQKEYFGGSIQGKILENSSGYFFASSKQFQSYSHQICIYHIDHSGDVVWAKHLGENFPITEFVNDYTFSNDSSEIIFVGNRSNGTANFANILIFKMDLNGNLIWHKILNDSLSNKAYAIYNNDEFYYVVGQAFASITNNQGGLGFVLKFDENGNVISNNFYTTNTNNPILLLGVIRKFNYLYLVGNLFKITTQENDILFMKTDTLGNILLSKIIGTSSQDYIRSMIMDHDNNNFILTGTTYGYNYPTRFQIKITGDGDIGWSKIIDIGSSNGASWLQKTKDLGYIFGTTNALIVKCDSLFNINWTAQFTPGWLLRGFHSAIETIDGGVIAGGIINNTSSSLVVKIDSNYNGGCNQIQPVVTSNNFNFDIDTLSVMQVFRNLVEISNTLPVYNLNNSVITYCQTGTDITEISEDIIQIYPNPVQDEIIIKALDNGNISRIEIYDALGNMRLTEKGIKNNELKLDISNINSGLLFIKIYDKQGSFEIEKIVKY